MTVIILYEYKTVMYGVILADMIQLMQRINNILIKIDLLTIEKS